MSQIDCDTVLAWASTAQRGDKIRLARRIGRSPQYVSNAIAFAREGKVTELVRTVAAAVRGLERAPVPIERVFEHSPTPAPLDDLVDAAVRLGCDAEDARKFLLARFPGIRNMFAAGEFVFARVIDQVEEGGDGHAD